MKDLRFLVYTIVQNPDSVIIILQTDSSIVGTINLTSVDSPVA